MVALRADASKIYPLYLFAALRSDLVQKRIKALNVDAVIPHLKKTDFDKLMIPLPEKAIQIWIGDFYFDLAKRIELLRETNTTLEAIAQALFKSWFVDFDPVHANAGTQAPSLPAEIQALFPSRLVESPQGLIPEGWKVGCLADILSLRNEKVKAGPKTAALPYVPIESITAKSPFLNEYKSGQEANSSLILFRKGDILFGAMRPYFHKVCLAPVDGVTRTTVFTLTPKDTASTAFALFTLFQESTIAFATQHSEGSTIPYAKWKNSLELMTTIVPPYEIQQAFNKLVTPIIESAYANIEKSKILTELRDTLLPRLISGQIRLSEAEAALAEVG